MNMHDMYAQSLRATGMHIRQITSVLQVILALMASVASLDERFIFPGYN